MIEELAPREFFQSISIMRNPNNATAKRPLSPKPADKASLIWYITMTQNTKSSINTSLASIKFIRHAALT